MLVACRADDRTTDVDAGASMIETSHCRMPRCIAHCIGTAMRETAPVRTARRLLRDQAEDFCLLVGLTEESSSTFKIVLSA